jgi:omega-amidase
MRITALQIEIHDGAPEANLSAALNALATAPQSDIYLLPELFTTGYAFAVWDEAASQHTPVVVQKLQQAARERDAAVLAGTIARNDDGRLVNRLWFVTPHEVRHYDKIHLIAAFREPELLVRGLHPLLVNWKGTQTHASICFDLRFPELYRAAALDGAEVFLLISEWPAKRSDAFVALARARAIENQAWMVLCNRTGTAADGTVFDGRSQIIDPEGNVVAEAGSGVGFCSAEINADQVREFRSAFPVLEMSQRGW